MRASRELYTMKANAKGGTNISFREKHAARFRFCFRESAITNLNPIVEELWPTFRPLTTSTSQARKMSVINAATPIKQAVKVR
jgi:hypothetical protein